MSRDPEFQKRNKKQFYALLRNGDRKEVYLSRYPGYIYLGLKSAQVYDNFVAEIPRSRIGREQRSIIIKLFWNILQNITHHQPSQLANLSSGREFVSQ